MKFEINNENVLLITRLGKICMILGIGIFIIENIYYGFNISPINNTEKIMTIISNYLFLIGFGLYFIPLIDLYNQFLKKINEK